MSLIEIQFPARPFEVGLERELTFTATNNRNRGLNLCIGPYLTERLNKDKRSGDNFRQIIPKGLAIVPEYSEALVELVTEPTTLDGAKNVIAKLDSVQGHFDDYVAAGIKKDLPRLRDYDLAVSNHGTTPYEGYLRTDGEVIDGIGSSEAVVLGKDRDFAIRYSDLYLKIGDYDERGVGIYNTLNSSHVTFHPRYTGDQDRDRAIFLRFLTNLDPVIEVYKKFDAGNKHIERQGRIFKTQENVRDLFLEGLYGSIYDGEMTHRYVPSQEPDLEIDNFEQLSLTLADFFEVDSQDGVDQPFRKWSSTNYRPRFTPDGVPVIEVRAFGSNVPSIYIQSFIYYLANLDRLYAKAYETK